MKNEHINGKRYINLVRCSTDQQADTSPTDQLAVLNQFARENGAIHAGNDFVLEGVSGSLPGARTDIDEIIARKEAKDDFDVLLVQDVSRLTRGGIDHTGKIKYDLAAAGIKVVFTAQGTTGNAEYDALIQSMGAFAAQQQVKSLSYATTRGQTSSLAAGNICHTFRVPYGIDRLYVGPDGKGRHRTRALTDRSQQKLAADTDEVLAHYPPNPKKGASIHYRRQSDEKIVLIPGAAECVAVVQQIYRRKLVDGWGRYRTALELNDANIPSPDGKAWNAVTIKKVLENPTYTGLGIASRYSVGLYHSRGTELAPVANERDERTMATRRSKEVRLRPESDWRKKAYPHLANYLGDELAERARDYHAKILTDFAARALKPKKKVKPGGDKHVDSPYVLKGLLRSKQGDHPMTGKTTGPKGNKRRYYTATRGTSAPKTGLVLTKLIPAEAVEKAVLALVRDVLLDVPSLRATIQNTFDEQQRVRMSEKVDVSALVNERDEISERLRDGLMLGATSRKLMQAQFDKWEVQLVSLEKRIATATTIIATPADAEQIVTTVIGRLAVMAESLGKLPPASLRQLLERLVTKLVVDMETKEVEVELSLPDGVAVQHQGRIGDDALCLDATSCRTRSNEAQRLNGLKIATLDCRDTQPARNQASCYACSRRAA